MAVSAPNPDPTTVPSVLINLYEVMRRSSYKRSTIYDYIKKEEFPAPVKIGRQSRWIEAEVQEWIDRQKDKREQDPATWEKRKPKNLTVNQELNKPSAPAPTSAPSSSVVSPVPGITPQAVMMIAGGSFLHLNAVQPQICLDPATGAVYLHIFNSEPIPPNGKQQL